MAKNDAPKNDAPKTDEKETKQPGPFAVLSPLDLNARIDEIVKGQPEGAEFDGNALAAITQIKSALDGVTVFELRGEYVGKTSKQAIGQAVGAHGGGEYIAVPKRSFTPRKVESVGVPRLKWS